MPADLWLAFAGFVFVAAITPGPNNTLLMASALNAGFKRTWPFLLGIQFGFCSLFLLLVFGLERIFEIWPVLEALIRYAGAAFLVWFAWKIATAPQAVASSDARTLSFFEGAAFQFLNPKAWIICLASISLYVPLNAGSLYVAAGLATWVVIGLPCNFAWMAGGRLLSRLSQRPAVFRSISILFALLLIASIVPVLAASREVLAG